MSILLSSAYLPPVSYVAECLASEKLIIERFETYTKQTCRNHCDIYGPNGLQTLSIPVSKVNGNHTLVKDVRIVYTPAWQKIHWKSIETAYNNSPFFLYYRDPLEPFFSKHYDFLIDFNADLLSVLFKILGVAPVLEFTDHFEKFPEVPDLRSSLVKKKRTHNLTLPEYEQPFRARSGFIRDLSIVDLLFNAGPDARAYLGSAHRRLTS
jgi:hypothetical protein